MKYILRWASLHPIEDAAGRRHRRTFETICDLRAAEQLFQKATKLTEYPPVDAKKRNEQSTKVKAGEK